MKTGKRILSLLLSLMLVLGTVAVGGINAAGAMTYQISNYDELKRFAYLVNHRQTDISAVLKEDIVCKNNQDDENYAADWEPIGSQSYPYTGVFDGQGHRIIGLTTYSEQNSYAGLFGYIQGVKDGDNITGGIVKNVGIEGGSITGVFYTGGVAGYNEGGIIENCFNTGTVYGSRNYIGGVVGYNGGGTVAKCYNTGNVSGDGSYVGGVAGGNLPGSYVENCYNTGNAKSSDNYAGGVVGYNEENAVIQNCYGTGTATANFRAGAVAGHNAGTATNCYYDGIVSNNITAFGNGVSGTNVAGLDTELMTAGTYSGGEVTNMTGFSSDVWLVKPADEFYSYYPHLRGFNTDSAGHQLAAEDIGKEDWPARKLNDNAYEIDSYDELNEFAEIVNGTDDVAPNPSACAVLTADIIANDKKWVPIANGGDRPFTGTFDGDGHKITGLDNSELNSRDNSGLFGYIGEGGSVKDVRLESTNFGGNSIGGIAHENNGTISGCSFGGTIACEFEAGGIAGKNTGTISNCCNTGNVSGNSPVGGIAGRNYGTVKNCYNTGSVTGSYNVGGIVGNSNGTVKNCYNTGNVTGDDSAGGVAGQNMNNGKVTDCYNTGNVTATGDSACAGGVAGYMDISNSTQNCSLTNCYSTGAVTAQGEDADAGGVVGYLGDNCTVENCYYDNEKCGCEKAVGNADDTGTVKSLTTAQMTGESALESMTFSYDEGVTSPWLTKANTGDYLFYPHLKGFNLENGEQIVAENIQPENWPAKIEYTAPAPTVFEISNYDELKQFAEIVNGTDEVVPNPSACAVLTADIIANDKKWVPIAKDEDYPFTGTFDGDGHKITGLDNSESGSTDYAGLFGYIGEGGSVKNLRLVSANLSSNDLCCGGIAGENNGTISGCSFGGTIAGMGRAGGIAGINDGTITNCYNTGDVSGNHYSGGIAGGNGGTVKNCYNTGDVSGNNYNGGITGRNTGTVANCYNTGDVTGNKYAGGVVGDNDNGGKVTDCYNTGNITGNNAVGGVVGYVYTSNSAWVTTITNCYSTGAVTAQGENDNYAGGVVGYNNNCTVENCYYDNEKCGCEKAVGNSADTNTVKGLTTAQMTGTSALGSMTFSYDEGVTSPWLTKANADGWAYYPHLKGFNLNDNGTQLSAEEIEPENWPAKIEYTAPAQTVFEISNYEELVAFARVVNGTDEVAPNPSACAILTADIECKNNPDDEEYAKDWVPIAKDEDYPFTGTFDGDGHKITGLDNSEAGNKNDSGLFGFIGEGGVVMNVRLENANFSGSGIGGIAHENNGTIQSCSFDGSIESGGAAGGIACDNSGTITDCYNNGTVSGYDPVGGIAGNNGGTVTNCCNTGGVSGSDNVGGIAGGNGGTVADCYNTGSVSGNSNVGGVLGSNMNTGTLTNSYNTGSVTGNSSVGGIAGYMSKNNPSWACSVTNCYSAGSVTLPGENAGYAGGVVGVVVNNCTVANCYYDSEKCDCEKAVGNADNTDTVTGLTTDKMTGESALGSMTFSYDEGVTSPWLTKENTGDWAYYPHLKGFAYDSVSTDENWPAKTEPPKADPVITLSVAPEERVLGDDIIITATLPEDATGTVTLAIEDKELTAPVDSDGTATFTIPGLEPGKWVVSVSYGGDDNYNAVTEELTVKIPKYSFTVTLEISPEEPVYGDDVIIIAHLPANATGYITLTVDGIAYTVPVRDGEAVCTVGSPAPGEHTVTASYPGDDNFTSASASVPFTVQAAVIAPTDIELDQHEIDFEVGATQVLTATIQPDGAEGTVTWFSSDQSVATVSDNNDGTATVTAAGVGTANITATVQGTEFSDICVVIVTEYICPHVNKTRYNAKSASCTESGNNEYYYCDDCHTYLKADGVTPTTVEEETISAPGHDWGMPTYTWDKDNNYATCTAKRECTRSGCGLEETETVNSSYTSTATCVEAGMIIYTASFTNAAFEAQEKEVFVDALGHNWQEVIICEATADSLGEIQEKCRRCGDTGAQWYYLLDDTSPSKYPNGGYISDETVQAKATANLDNSDITVIVQDPLEALPNNYEIVIKSVSADLGNDYDGALQPENAYKANVVIKINGEEISGQLPGKVRLLLEIPDGWDINDVKAFLINIGQDDGFTECIEYQVYDGDGNYIKTVDKDYQPEDGETVKVFAAIWTDHFSPYALVDVYTDRDALEDYKADAKEALENYKDSEDYRPAEQTELQNAVNEGIGAIENAEDTDGVDTALENAKAAIDEIKTDEQLTAEELEAAKAAAKEELRNYKDSADYRPAEQTELQNAVNEGIQAIENAEDTDGVDTALENAKAVIDGIKTDAEYAAEELEANKEAFEEYKEDAKAEIDALAQEGDSDETKAILEDAKNEIDAKEYNENQSLEENEAALDAIVENAGTAAEEQREAEQLEANKEAFEEYKEEKKAEIDALAQEDDSDETKALIDEAKKEIDDLEYDENKSLEENKAAADAVVDDAEEAVEEQREAEKLEPAIWIDDFEDNTEIGYKEDMIFRASTADMPEGAEIHWFVNGEDVGTGEGLGVEEPTEDYTVQAKMLDKDGNVIAESGTMNVKVRNGFFDRLLAFFASLFDMIFGGFLSDLFGRIC